MEVTYLWPRWLSESYHPRCCWAGLPVDDQQTAATLIKEAFPDSWMYVNEAFPVFALGKSRPTSSSGPMHPSGCATKIPKEIDIYSVDASPGR